MREPGATDLVESYDPFSPDVMANPLPYYRALRQESPVHYVPKYDTWFLSRFAETYEMLATGDNVFVGSESTRPTPEVLCAHHRGVANLPQTEPLAPHSFYGSPTYERLRNAHSQPMRPAAVRTLEPLIRQLARERLDILVPRGRFDLTQHYGGIVAAAVQCHIFRVPLSEAKHVLDMINAGSRTDPTDGSFDPRARNDRLCEFVEPIVRERRRVGADGSFPLVDGLLALEVDGRKLEDREIAMTIGIVMLGGTETLPKVIAHGLWALQRHPDQLAAVRQDLPRNAARALREMVRLFGPAQWFLRTVHSSARLGGASLEVGQRVAYLIPSAARDEAEYGEDSESFRWDRDIHRWVNFGFGQHFCLGYHLALLEGQVMLEEFLRRVPSFEVVESDARRPPSSFQWGWNELPIVVDIDTVSGKGSVE